MTKVFFLVVLSFLAGASFAAPVAVSPLFDAHDCTEKITVENDEIVVKMCDRVRDSEGNLVEVEQKRIFSFDGQKKFEVMTIKKLFIESQLQSQDVDNEEEEAKPMEEEAKPDADDEDGNDEKNDLSATGGCKERTMAINGEFVMIVCVPDPEGNIIEVQQLPPDIVPANK